MLFFWFFRHFWLAFPPNAETTGEPAFLPVRILHLHDAPHLTGGATHYLGNLLREWDRRGHSQALFSLGQADSALPGSHHSFPYSMPQSIWRRRKDFHGFFPELADCLETTLDSFQPDLVHLQNWPVFRPTLYRVLGKRSLPIFQTVHDQALRDPNPTGRDRGGPWGLARRFLDRRRVQHSFHLALETTDVFFCHSLSIACNLGLAEEKTALIRLPIPKADSQHPGGTRAEGLHLLFAGSLFRSKGADLLLRALAQLPKAWSLSLAGEGDQKNKLQSLSKALKIQGRVSFLGHLTPQELTAARLRADLAVIPSRVPETASLVALEAGALGLPVVAPAAGAMPEALAPPKRGWLFRPGDVEDLKRVLLEAADPTARQGRALSLQAWVLRECEPQAHYDKQEDWYRRLLAERKVPQPQETSA